MRSSPERAGQTITANGLSRNCLALSGLLPLAVRTRGVAPGFVVLPRWGIGYGVFLLAVVCALTLAVAPSANAASGHWSFQPLSSPDVPELQTFNIQRLGASKPRGDDGSTLNNRTRDTHPPSRGSFGATRHATRNTNPIDSFIHARLAESRLAPSPRADRRTLIRRLYLDLHGLPPTMEQIRVFESSTDERAWESLVDDALASPRYGERWAQHWLDVVRYADTHGYEVNTPRENAWPYRDYVIRAFNEDKPYDRFVFEQLAGDTVGEDAATGFMVAAAALLPGQIGKDDASKRLARQDALDEIIVGTGESFLGLTIGCARCHEHKFDPISHEEYYSLQAFFAGVEYGDRRMESEASRERIKQAEALEPRLAAAKQKANALEPIAFVGRTILIDDEDLERVTILKEKAGHGTNPSGTKRGYKDDKGDANRMPNLSRSRYTWWKHKPGEDVFTYNPKAAGRFRVWLSWGAHGSGVHTRDARYVLDADGDLKTLDDQKEIAKVDQYYFAGVSKGETEKKPLWSGLLDAGVHEFGEKSRLIIRGGDTGTGVTADVVLFQEEPVPFRSSRREEALFSTPRFSQSLLTSAATGRERRSEAARRHPRLREPVNALRNVEKFRPIKAKFVRFTSFATIDNDKHEPCIDELQVFTADKARVNIARAIHGTKPTSSGNRSTTGKHQLKHINDNVFGNSRSWISNEKGKGWVQLEFKEPVEIDQIVWGRDREGKFKDRLPVDYRVDAAMKEGEWTTVASSRDRAPMGTPLDKIQFKFRNLEETERPAANDIFAEVNSLESRINVLRKPDMVYGGIFREPDETRVLARGDPEQPKEIVAPKSLSALEPIGLKRDSSDRERRTTLADWIASADNPLTARVMVNRVWQYHFGTGLVETPSDFGRNGGKPSHPELLDWLAGEFIRGGWSVKRLHKLILTSETYRQSSRIDETAQKVDADCRLLWRFPSRRLEAEAIRDSMLQASGVLNLAMGGRGYSFFKSRGGLSGFPPVEKFGPSELRRMIYSHKIRMERVPVFGAFDCPDAGQPMPKRGTSTTAIQALNLFNSPFVMEQAERLAAGVKARAGKDARKQTRMVYEQILGREPTATELEASVAAVERHGLSTLCRALFNSNEFLFLP